ncbi:MAG: Rpn family recombination-promoting nuclease/putative transposase [Lachnospiraceae bacterium]|nr:Rpn family recombination-promoting nuclease/putative transposase [Lachnospiraceae bacterium]
MAKDYQHFMEYSSNWKNNTGELEFPMTNDYLFRALLQKDEKTLRALVATFLNVEPERINDVEITNPVVLGESIDDKEYHLDVMVLVDHNRKMNLEMQVLRHDGWNERTLAYACREFDDLNKGAPYTDILGIWQISICCFDLFEDEPEFFSDFLLINTKKPKQIYSTKLRISNVNLNRINLASEEDVASGLTDWARLFKAKSWEELKMLAQDNTTLDQAASSISQLTSDKKIRDEIWRREDNARIELTNRMAYESVKKQLEEKDAQLEEKNAQLDIKDAQLEVKDAEIERLQKILKEHNISIN